MDFTTAIGIIIAVLIVLLALQTFQLVSIRSKLSITGAVAGSAHQVPTGGAVTPTQLPAQRGGC